MGDAMFVLQKTCSACPEQYNVFCNGEMVAYLRLRHGHFTVTCPDASGTDIYSACPSGDGAFDSNEREYFLSKACEAIKHYLENGPDGSRAYTPGLYVIE